MKIMKGVDKKVGDTIYYKYKINLPKKIVEESGLGDKEVKIILSGKKIVIEKDDTNNKKLKLTEKEKRLQKELMKIFEVSKN